MDHSAFHELAAGAALDDLDQAEQRTFLTHAGGCGPCARLSGELDEVVGELALAAPAMWPPAGLGAAILAATRGPANGGSLRPQLTLVRESGTPVADAGTSVARAGTTVAGASIGVASAGAGMGIAGAGRSRRMRLGAVAGLAAAAVFGVVALGSGMIAVRMSSEIADVRSQLDAQGRAMAVAVAPGHESATLQAGSLAPDAHALVVWEPGTREAYLMADGLPATPAGRVYQLWWADAGGVHPLGTFRYAGSGPFVAPFGVDLEGAAAAMVTLEPDGGASGAPGPQVAFGEL